MAHALPLLAGWLPHGHARSAKPAAWGCCKISRLHRSCASVSSRTIRLEKGTEAPAEENIRQAKYFADGIQNIVFMGMGEPLDNFDNVVQAIRVFTEPAGLDFPHGQITVSTVGRIDGLRKLAEICKAEPVWRNLRIAISLNAANDTLRNELMPVNKAMPLAELKRALREYPLAPKGRFLVEYVLIKGVNDSLADADAVIDFCRDLPCIVNLIPYNPQRFAAYETPGRADDSRLPQPPQGARPLHQAPRHPWPRTDGRLRPAWQPRSACVKNAVNYPSFSSRKRHLISYQRTRSSHKEESP